MIIVFNGVCNTEITNNSVRHHLLSCHICCRYHSWKLIFHLVTCRL